MDARVWRLPGPSAFIHDIGTELIRGRHVAVVLPSALCTDEPFTDSLAVALIEHLHTHQLHPQRVHPQHEARSLLDNLCEALVWRDGDIPATVPELLFCPEVAGSVGVLVAADFCSSQRQELPGLLRRVETESRAHTDSSGRLSLVAIVDHRQLPSFSGGADTEVGMATIWWWGRVARWDATAHVVGLNPGTRASDVLEETRLETIVDVARWDLDLGERLASAWNGEPAELISHLRPATSWTESVARNGHAADFRPPLPLMDAWDERAVDSWHGSPRMEAAFLAADEGEMSRVVWAAQARVLLPWVEQRRVRLLETVIGLLGPRRFDEVLVRRLALEPSSDALIEIGVLDRAVRIGLGKTRADITEASRRLRVCRNAMAHLTPLTLSEQSGLVAACRVLA